MDRFIAYCGLDCKACEARIATVNDDDALREKVAKLWSELNNVEITPDMINCTGCRVDGVKTPYCDSICSVRKCASRNGYETCGSCDKMEVCEKVGAITENSEEALRNLERYRKGNHLMEIPVTQIGSISIGQTEDREAGTGCTVFISKEGMPAGLDVRGGGPSSRESGLLDPLASAGAVHAVVFAGGSAFGLSAAGGVMEYLEEKGIGYDTGVAKVPLVVQSDIFDLTVGDPAVRPDAAMGYEAARIALESPNYRDGNYGAGCGASVGKMAGMETAMKTGIGSYAVRIEDLEVGAVAVVNALGDVFDWKTGRKIAGMLAEDRKDFRDTAEYMARSTAVMENKFTGNTTLGIVITNAAFDKTRLCKIAGMAHDGLARSVRPVHTSADGDSIYAVSVGDVEADQDLVGILSAEVMSEAIKRAVLAADGEYGLVSAKELIQAKEMGAAE